ncbi:Redoxin [Phycisphaerae bacterium RAS1]|nr:Redoxin [Phycisphaerae bacterium RAS1]
MVILVMATRRAESIAARWTWRLLVGAIMLAAPLAAQSAGRDAGEETLWRAVAGLRQHPQPASQPYVERLADLRRCNAEIIDQATAYLALYPGGAHRDEIIRIELAARFELASLSADTLPAFTQRLRDVLKNPPSRESGAEAAFWKIHADRMTPQSATQPVGALRSPSDPSLIAAYRDFVRDYPSARHTPRLAQLVFEDAADRGERETMRAMLNVLEASFPEHPTTQRLAGLLRRVEQAGQGFELSFVAADGRLVNLSALRGGPIAVVVWAASDLSSLRAMEWLHARPASDSALHVIGVNLDDSPARMRASMSEREITWPQLHDGMGWGGEFVRRWAVEKLPTVFVIDARGRLVGVSSKQDEWQGWLMARP